MVGNHRVQSSPPEGYVIVRMLDVMHVLADCRLSYFCLLRWILGFLTRCCRAPLGCIFCRSDVGAYFVAQICREAPLQWHPEDQAWRHMFCGSTCSLATG